MTAGGASEATANAARRDRAEGSTDSPHELSVPWRELGRRAWPLFLARGATFGMTLASFSLVGRYLGPQRFGAYILAFALPMLVAPLVDFGFSAVVTREIARGSSPRWALGGLVASWVAVPLIWAALLAGAWAAGLRDPTFTLLAVSSLQLPMVACRALEARLVAEKRTRELGLLAVTGNAVALVAVAAAVTLRAPDAVVMAAHISYLAVYTVLVAIRASRGLGAAAGSLRLARQVSAEAWPYGAGAMLASITERIGVGVVFFAVGATAAGLYGASHRFYEIAVLVAGVAMTVVFPHLSVVGVDPAMFSRQTTMLLRGSMAASGSAALGVAALSPVLLTTTFGTTFAPAAPILVALSPAIANSLPGNLVAFAGVARGLRSRYLAGTAGAALVAVAGSIGLSVLAGPAGVGLALALAGTLAIGWIAAGFPEAKLLRTYLALSGVWWVAFGLVVVVGSELQALWARAVLAAAAGGAHAWIIYRTR